MVQPPQAGLGRWVRIRRHAVPPTMIAEATAAREAGDWRGACAAARIDVQFDLADVRREYGSRGAEAVEEELVHLAPDLLRWHLPRELKGTALAWLAMVVLAWQPGGEVKAPVLCVYPPHGPRGPQRPRLRIASRGRIAKTSFHDAPRYLWDVRRAGDLCHAWGGSHDRPPLLEPDATPVEAEGLGMGTDRAAGTERVMAEVYADRHVEAWRAAGIRLTVAPGLSYEPLTNEAIWPVGVADEAQRLAEVYGVGDFALANDLVAHLRVKVARDGRVTARVPRFFMPPNGRPTIMPAVGQRPADLELVWHGLLDPDELHPLVRASVLPRLGPPAPRPDRLESASVRVRCRDGWHRVQVVDGHLTALDHDAGEERREAVVRALGGTSSGCFAVLLSWVEGTGRLPKDLHRQRRDLYDRMLHGDARIVLAMLDAGTLDPHMRDGEGLTVLHMLSHMDHEVLVPRLLAAGLPVDVRDHLGRTPLYCAVLHRSVDLVRALFAAGADPDAADAQGRTVRDLVSRTKGDEIAAIIGRPRRRR